MTDQSQRRQNLASILPEDPELFRDLQRLAVARMRVLPDDVQMLIGSTEFTINKIVKHIDDGDEVGRQVMAMQLEYLQGMAKGEIYQDD